MTKKGMAKKVFAEPDQLSERQYADEKNSSLEEKKPDKPGSGNGRTNGRVNGRVTGRKSGVSSASENARRMLKQLFFDPAALSAENDRVPEKKTLCSDSSDRVKESNDLDGFDKSDGRMVMKIGIEAIHPNPGQPRRYFSPEALASLANSIAQHGILQPLTVRSGEAKDEYELIAGERRLRAAALAGLTEVPCILCEMDRTKSAYLAIIENIQRADLDMFEEAAAILSLSAEHNMTQEEIARTLSCSQSNVANKLRLLRLTEKERREIVENGLTERHARAFLRIRDEERRLYAISLVVRGKMNVSATEELVEALLKESENQVSLEENLPEQPGRKRRFVLKDIRLFYNSVEHAMELVRLAGIDVQSRRLETEEATELRITIRKEKPQGEH